MTTLDNLRKLHAATTPGPWIHWIRDDGKPGSQIVADHLGLRHTPIMESDWFEPWDNQQTNDRELIVALRNYLPKLLALYDAAKADLNAHAVTATERAALREAILFALHDLDTEAGK